MWHSEADALAPRDASCPHLRRESQSGTRRSRENTLGSHTKAPCPAATLEGRPGASVPRRAGTGAAVAILTAPARPDADYDDTVAPAAFAASRTAPATAPATLSLKTLGMM
ncbi:hypothetical protein ALMP_43350 [Streptomyces sp. A012304]|nr:hypothetical protein ALMP_43350 [Streptomyces sp. A012304]